MRFSILSSILLLFSCNSNIKKEVSQEQDTELNISIKRLNSPVSSSIRGISCLDSTTIWLSGAKGTIIRSLDGGDTWKQLAPPDNDSLDFRDVEAFSKDEAIIASAGYPSRVYRTVNGGENWSLVHENKDSAAFMNSIAFKSQYEGFILGDQLNGRHLILHSEDKGVSWKRIDSADVPKPLPIENGFAASGSCIAINKNGNLFIGLGGEQTRVFSSLNGLKWSATTTPMIHGNNGASGIYSIAHGNNMLIAVGGNYSLPDSTHFPIISTNNGKSWTHTKGEVKGYRSIVDYSEKENLWVCGGTNGLDLSTDNGGTWEMFSTENINTLQFLPHTSRAIVANSKGNILILDFHLTIKED